MDIYIYIYLYIYVYMYISISKLPNGLSSQVVRGWGTEAARLGHRCPWRPCWLDLGSNGSIWPPLAPSLARFGCSVRSWAPQLARFGCPARSWAPWLGRFGCKRMPQRLPHRHDWQKKNDLLFDDPASMLPASCALERFFMPQI